MDCWRQILACQQFEPLPSTSLHRPILVWGRYQGALRRAIGQLKYQNKPMMASLLGEELGLRWLREFPSIQSFQVIPIPLHHDRLAQRGYNQAELIAKRFSQVVGVPCLSRGLIRNRPTEAQHTLGASDRQNNLQGAFSVSPNVSKQKRRQAILIIDDIFTTGTTMTEATKALEASQVRVLGTAVVAQALRG